jgi:hypothetical protein
MSDDPDLRQRFASLRREEGARTPRFERVLRRVPPRPSSVWFGPHEAAAACLVIAAGWFLYAHVRAPRPPEAAVASLADWRSPLDFLLNTPGAEMLSTVPEIGDPSPDTSGAGPRLNDITPARRADPEPT